MLGELLQSTRKAFDNKPNEATFMEATFFFFLDRMSLYCSGWPPWGGTGMHHHTWIYKVLMLPN